MARDLDRVLRERQEILARIAAQRLELGTAVGRLERPAAFVDRGIAAVQYLKSRPLLVGAAVAVLVALRGRSTLALVARGVGLWQVVQRVGRFARTLRT